MSQHPDHMMARMPDRPGQVTAATAAGANASAGRPGFRIVVPAEDGATLLELFERDGKLAIEWDHDRTEEAAMRFLDAMRQWSGQVGIRWQDEVDKAVRE